MLPLIPIAIGGALGALLLKGNGATSSPVRAAPSKQPLMQRMSGNLDLFLVNVEAGLATANGRYRDFADSNPQPSAGGLFEEALIHVQAAWEVADERYQEFVQLRVDPLLGQTRHAQMQQMLGDSPSALTPALTDDERFANRRIALGLTALTFALIGSLVFAPFIPVAIAIGLAAMWGTFRYAYMQLKATKRLGALQLLCVYILFLWLGGYALIGAVGALLMGVGLKIKSISENRSRNNLINVFQLQPETVWVRVDGGEVEIAFDRLQVGDILVAQAGQAVPVDGVITSGVAAVDQHMLTGEAEPVEKGPGDSVMAATILVSGKIDVRVEKTGADTTAGQIGKILNQTAQLNTKMSLKVLEMTDRFALPTLGLSALSLPFIGPAGAVSLMGSNFTITTYMTGPLAVLNFLNLAAENSILVKDGQALEMLNDVDTVVFDKTGTLTMEQPQVCQIHTVDVSESFVLRLAATAEARQTHPIARAILAAAEARHLPLSAVDQAHYEVGYGIKVWLSRQGGDGSEASADPGSSGTADPRQPTHFLVRVGSGRFMTMEGIQLPSWVEVLSDNCRTSGHSLVMVALDDRLAGCIELRPTVRPEAKSTIDELRRRGLSLFIVSGDQEAPTRKLANDLGMTGYFANTLPEQKATLVEGLQEQGRRVCFIGDGINDAIAMRKAQVSISLRGATSAATDTAQIILMEGNLDRLVKLFELSAEFERNLGNNLKFTSAASVVTAAGILFAGFTFAATEILYSVALLGGLWIAMEAARKREADLLKQESHGN